MKKPALLAAALLLLAAPASAATIAVKAGESVQAAITKAQPGDEITLEPGAKFAGALTLPAKPFGPKITIRSAAVLPERRIGPADVALFPSLSASGAAVITAGAGAANWRLDGLKLEPTFPFGEVLSIAGASAIDIDRIYIVASGTQQQKRAIGGNGKSIKLTRSYIAGIWVSGQDSQAFCAWDGAGPYTIVDNYLEAASENILFGGADSSAPENLPSDILIEGNTITKPLAWKGTPHQVKNLVELKAARRAVIRNNLIENSWPDAQAGFAVLFTPRNQDGQATWTQVADVLFEKNIVRNAPNIFQVMGYDGPEKKPDGTIVPHTSLQTDGIVIRQNLFLGAGGGRLANVTNENGSVTFDHNTYIQPQVGEGAPLIGLYAEGDISTPAGIRAPTFAAQKLVVTNNLFQYNKYGFHSSNFAQGTATLNGMTKAWEWKQNVLGGGSGSYPAGTFFVALSAYPALFTADSLLLPGSAYAKAGTDSLDIGWAGQAAAQPPAPPSTPSGVSVSVSFGTQKCRISVSAEPPDTSGGWTAAIVPAGSDVKIVWSKPGQSNVEVIAGACK